MRKIAPFLLLVLFSTWPVSSRADTSVLTLRIPEVALVAPGGSADPFTVSIASWGTPTAYTATLLDQTFADATQTLEVEIPASLLGTPLHVMVQGTGLNVPLAGVVVSTAGEETSGQVERPINVVTTLATAMANHRRSATPGADATTLLNGALADALSLSGALGSLTGSTSGGSSGSRPPCETGGQYAAMSAWNCANALAGRIPNGGSQLSTLSGAIQDQVGCELPPGFFQTAPSWTGYVPVYSQITSLGDIISQCGINLPAALMTALLDHLGNVGIPPEAYGIGSATQRECTTSDGRPGRLILSPLGSRCIADEVGPPPSCTRPAPTCTMPNAVDNMAAFCVGKPMGTIFTLRMPRSCTDAQGTVNGTYCTPAACGVAGGGSPPPY